MDLLFAGCQKGMQCFQNNLKTVSDVNVLTSVSDANVRHMEATVPGDRRETRLEYPKDLQKSFIHESHHLSVYRMCANAAQ
jgi:hypothetical protein